MISPSLWRNMEGKQKTPKVNVNYRRADGRHRCGNCDMMHQTTPFIGDCDLVAGVIESDAVCKEWVVIGSARALKKERYIDHDEPKTPGG